MLGFELFTLGYLKPAIFIATKVCRHGIYTSKANDLGELFRQTITDFRETKPIKANDFILGPEANDLGERNRYW